MQSPRFTRYSKRCGLTIVELLVVTTIILLLLVTTLSTVRYAYEGRAVIEADRQLHAFIGSAQAKAKELGRPVGIWIQPFSSNPEAPEAQKNYSNQVFLAETPRLFTGVLPGSRLNLVTLVDDPIPYYYLDFDLTSPLRGIHNRLIKFGERFQIQFDRKGNFFDAIRIPNFQGVASYRLVTEPNNFQRPPGHFQEVFGNPEFYPSVLEGSDTADLKRIKQKREYSFTIRLPARRSYNAPLKLPRGAVIDLSVSGLGTSENAIHAWETAGKPIDDLNATTIGSEFRCKLVPGNNIENGPIKIMFSPTGAVESVSYGFRSHKPISPIYLLVGKEKQVRPAAGEILMDYEKEKANLRDMKNKWLVINQQSGATRSSLLDHVNGPNPSNRVAGPTNTSLPRSTYNSRQLSRESSTGGGE